MKNLQTFFLFFGIFFCTTSLYTSSILVDAAIDIGIDSAEATARSTFISASLSTIRTVLTNIGNYFKGFLRTDSKIMAERLNMAFDMGMPMGVGMAASNANEFISQQQQSIWADLTLEQTIVATALTSWSAQQKDLVTKQTELVGKYFQSQSANIQNTQENILPLAQAEANCIFQNVSLAQPAASLVSFPSSAQFDLLFANGIMATPVSNFIWYNVFRQGDWLFDPTRNSFWQNQAVPFSSTQKIIDSTKSFDPTKPDPITVSALCTNSIFVEYYPSIKPYTISGSFTLYSLSYPFFAGIMFNKNRWISGDLEGEFKSRLFGIYATSASTAGIYFAEQYELSNADATASNDSNPVKQPLLQIINGHVKSLSPINQSILNKITSEPITFHFTITTNPTSVSCKLWSSLLPEPSQAFLIQNLNSNFYIYHTLGFMSPGAATEWNIIDPEELRFSSQNITNLKNKVFPKNN